jgi:2-polyprenyl-6-methoxyphenol hydroxylase-like FAD-dependent oxidoreductase
MVDALVLTRLLASGLREPTALHDAGQRYEAVRRRFVGILQTGSYVAAKMPGWRWPFVKRWRDAILKVQDRIPWSKHRTLLLVAGYNPREQVYLGDNDG